MAKLPRTAEALARGVITGEHADVMADAAKEIDPILVDAELLPMARREATDLFARHARDWVADNGTDADTAGRHERQHKRRSTRSWTDRDGMRVWLARLDPETAASVAARLDTEYERLWRLDGGRDLGHRGQHPSHTGTRSPEQRMADAFIALITRPAGTTADTQPHVRRQMLSIVDLTRMRTDGHHGAAGLADGTPLPQNALERLACISDITGVIFDGPAQPIWVGRTSRSATIAQWKALIARDRGCIGCGIDPNRCEAHHINPWNRGGPTDIDNLVLVCSRCHHNIHDRGMQLTRQHDDGGWTITPRAGPITHRAAA